MPTPVFGDPYCGPFWKNEGVCQSAQNGPNRKFPKPFSTKSKLKGDPFFEKNCQLMYLWLHNAGHFVKMGVSADRPKMDQF